MSYQFKYIALSDDLIKNRGQQILGAVEWSFQRDIAALTHTLDTKSYLEMVRRSALHNFHDGVTSGYYNNVLRAALREIKDTGTIDGDLPPYSEAELNSPPIYF